MGTMEALTTIGDQFDAVAWLLLAIGAGLMAVTSALRATDAAPVLVPGFVIVTAFVTVIALAALLLPFLTAHGAAAGAWLAALLYAAAYLLVLEAAYVIARRAARTTTRKAVR